ncbi:MAG: hypothetical protein HOA66_03105 [Candidatus Marinimicrobia bacterium]|nr:hypothetical protein [Candidatus Neomarinimicrobiota bacterium]
MKPIKSLYNLLDKMIDYAGLFPPAKLAIEPSLKNYAEYIKSTDKWMMSRFIVPVSRLDEISTELMEVYSEEFPLSLSLISGDICNEIDSVNQFLNTHGNSSIFMGYESRISDLSTFSQRLLDIHQLCNNHNYNFNSFYEVAPSDNWLNEMKEAVSQISIFNSENNTEAGFKLRCGGVAAHMFPSAENIAHAILACRDAHLPMKFTAGLHHPIRHYNESVKTKMYGFFNIFIGGMIAHKFNLKIDELITILSDEDNENFTFDENTLCWKNYSISNTEIQTYRQDSFISYGSCSFNEPREDLQQLGLL